jgi:hypothetical protein
MSDINRDFAQLHALAEYQDRGPAWSEGEKRAHNIIARAILEDRKQRAERASQPIPYEARQQPASALDARVEQTGRAIINLALQTHRTVDSTQRTRLVAQLLREAERLDSLENQLKEAHDTRVNHPSGDTFLCVIDGKPFTFELGIHWQAGVTFEPEGKPEWRDALFSWALANDRRSSEFPVWTPNDKGDGTIRWRLQQSVRDHYPHLPLMLELIRRNLVAVRVQKAA